jgi:hypothetical protein
MQEDWKKYLHDEEEKYKRMGSIKCPAFNNEEIYFNDYGLNHLMYKGRFPRSREEVMKRFHVLSYLPNILRKIKSVDYEEKREKERSTAYFWTIKYKLHNDLKLRIIIRRLNNGTLHFFSIMKE